MDSRTEYAVVGTVTSGRGLAARRMRRKQTAGVLEPLGFIPHPGTLNLTAPDLDRDRVLRLPKVLDMRGRPYWPARVGRHRVLVVIHDRHIELVARVRLRDALGITDGDRITVHFQKEAPHGG